MTYIKDKDTNDLISLRILIALLPFLVIKSIVNIQAITNIMLGALISLVINYAYYLFIKKDIKEFKKSSSIFPGFLLGIIVPSDTPLLILTVALIISSLTKVICDKKRFNYINPVIIGYILIALIYNINPCDFMELKNRITIENMLEKENVIVMVSLFFSVISLIYLSITYTIKNKITIAYTIALLIMTYVICTLLKLNLINEFCKLIPLIFISIFVITDTKSSCVTPVGQVLQAIFLAILTVLFKYIGIDVMIGILLMNLAVPLLDKVGAVSRFNLLNSIILFVVAWVIIIALCLIIYLLNKNMINTNYILNWL